MTRRISASLALFCFAVLSIAGCAQPPETGDGAAVEANVNTITITSDGTLLWNEKAVSLEELAQRLEDTKRMAVEPELKLEPDPSAPYDVSAAALMVIKESGVTKFGFVGNEKYRVRGADGN